MPDSLELDNAHQAMLGFGVLFAAIFLLSLLVCYAKAHSKPSDDKPRSPSKQSPFVASICRFFVARASL